MFEIINRVFEKCIGISFENIMILFNLECVEKRLNRIS
jgi:hypothetical protein